MRVALLITTYNNPTMLEMCFKSIEMQTKKPDEVLIADDGSAVETANLINKYQKKIPNLRHIWHEDKGYRRAAILNKAIQETTCDYIITTDQDCILHKNYIEDHLYFASKGFFATAYRTFLFKPITSFILRFKIIPHRIFLLLFSKINLKYNLRLRSKWNSATTIDTEDSLNTFGCNMAFWKEDIMAVNGYDENFSGWGREDSELVLRLLKKGVYLKTIKLAAIQYHLHHKENDRMNFEKNHEIMMESLNRSDYVAKKGIIKKEPL